MKNSKVKSEFQRMYETRSVRPYYSISHIGMWGKPFKKLTGFEYKKTVYVTSSDMNNTAYFEVEEMRQATNHFRKVWKNKSQISFMRKSILENFKKASTIEKWSWNQTWDTKSTSELLSIAKKLDSLLMDLLATMVISNPQHVKPLEETINEKLINYEGKDLIIKRATSYPGDLPWTKEEKELSRLHKKWSKISFQEKNKILVSLVNRYGWFNEIEGDKPFNKAHYKAKIETFELEPKVNTPKIRIPATVKYIGGLIGEFGYYRLWNRYHFMHIRYHLKKVLEELVKRSGNSILGYATVVEVKDFYEGRKIPWTKIKFRKEGYVSILEKGKTKILTGKLAEKYRKQLTENIDELTSISGSIANKGRVIGKVRIISFSAKDYDKQVANFKKGEILITGMTRPQIVHLCKKAAAIVTDEGGITSHAAVISREFGTPCIIGTKNATKIFKTGDTVDVDAYKGTVRLVKN